MYKATLPNYVDWTSQIDPASSQVSFDTLTRTVSWKIGDILSGAGYSSPAKQVFFQVAVNPSVGQIGTTPIVIKDQSVTGTDGLTGEISRVGAGNLDVKIEQDPGYVFGYDRVLGE